jgi:transcriptional regulator with XRE-family HTH domain
MKNTPVNLALKMAIFASGRTQGQIAMRARILETRLSQIVRKRVTPTPEERAKLARALHRAASELFDSEAA